MFGMKAGTENGEKKITLLLSDNTVELLCDESIIDVCSEIRSKAKIMLDGSKSEASEGGFVESVKIFLQESIRKLLGERLFEKVGRCCGNTVPELTNVLCYIISELGAAFAEEGVEDDE